MKTEKYLREDLHDITVVLLGAGGNGSFMLTCLARINYALIALGKKGLFVTLIDHDAVSPSNVGRQLFSPSDIGKNKASVLIERVNRVYGTAWKSSEKKIEAGIRLNGNLFISAVDNVEARRHFYMGFMDSKINIQDTKRAYYWLDMGNGKDFGQIILTDGKKIPGLFQMFPDLRDDPDDGPSCSMQEALARQDLFVNSILTQYAGKMVWDLLSKETIEYHAVFVNLRNLETSKIKTPVLLNQ